LWSNSNGDLHPPFIILRSSSTSYSDLSRTRLLDEFKDGWIHELWTKKMLIDGKEVEFNVTFGTAMVF